MHYGRTRRKVPAILLKNQTSQQSLLLCAKVSHHVLQTLRTNVLLSPGPLFPGLTELSNLFKHPVKARCDAQFCLAWYCSTNLIACAGGPHIEQECACMACTTTEPAHEHTDSNPDTRLENAGMCSCTCTTLDRERNKDFLIPCDFVLRCPSS